MKRRRGRPPTNPKTLIRRELEEAGVNLGLLKKPPKRLIILPERARGLSQRQREILAWLWLLQDVYGVVENGVKWNPTRDLLATGPGESASISRALRRLESRGLIQVLAPNGRCTFIALTPDGTQAGEKLVPQFARRFCWRLRLQIAVPGIRFSP